MSGICPEDDLISVIYIASIPGSLSSEFCFEYNAIETWPVHANLICVIYLDTKYYVESKNFKLSLLYRSHFKQKAKYENETNTNRSESIFVLTGVSWPVQRLLRKTGRSLLLAFQALLFTSVSHFTAFVA